MTTKPNHFLAFDDLSPDDVRRVLDRAHAIKAAPAGYTFALARRSLLMIFAKPSLRTRLSFEVGMTQLGGHAIYYGLDGSPIGSGKESFADTARAASRMVDGVMARLFAHADLEDLARHSVVPVVNGLTDFAHPCQTLADLFTLEEKRGTLRGLTLAYLGDANNNVTHSLIQGCAAVGIHMRIGCPPDPRFRPDAGVLSGAIALAASTGGSIRVCDTAHDAVAGGSGDPGPAAEVVYTDSWFSYHVPKEELVWRTEALAPFRVDGPLLASAAKDALFMNCLPAHRGQEQTAEVIDGPQSIVFDQAENRLHAQKGLLVDLLAPGFDPSVPAVDDTPLLT